jgi:ABC-2 type transport system ATP-binding protein
MNIRIEKLCLSIKGKKILNNINLSIDRGEKVAILGPNGSGKTTLINVMMKVVASRNGTVKNEFLHKLGRNYPIGIHLNEFVAERHLTVWETLDLFSSSGPDFTLIRQLGLENKLKQRIGTLSTGEYQKVQYIIAIQNTPSLLILDEITTGIDTLTRKKIIDQLTLYCADKSKTLIFVTHYLEEATIADRFVIIKDGTIIEDIQEDQICKKYKPAKKIHIVAREEKVLARLNITDIKQEGNNRFYAQIPIKSKIEYTNILKYIIDNDSLIAKYSVAEQDIRDIYGLLIGG